MILTEKPQVICHRGRYHVKVVHTTGVHFETWRTHLSAMNCALAIARTSPNNWPLPDPMDGSWKAY